jgi:hypothetical protein
MEFTRLAGECKSGDDCATVYATGRGTIAVQGTLMQDIGRLRPPAGEAVVEIPLDVLLEAAREAGR